MLKVAITVLAIGAALVAQEIKKVPIQSVPTASAASGPGMFDAYCAVCHGTAGKGDGPAATALKKRPADLTQLARKNNGRFPEVQVMNYITGNDVVAAHGSRDMPVWGNLFRTLNPDNDAVSKIRVKVLAGYVKSLQAQ